MDAIIVDDNNDCDDNDDDKEVMTCYVIVSCLGASVLLALSQFPRTDHLSNIQRLSLHQLQIPLLKSAFFVNISA